jgi:poly(A) polymerase
MDKRLKQLFKDVERHPMLAFLRVVREKLPDSEWFLVGGAVRDTVMGRVGQGHDFDLVVRGVDLDEVSAVLEPLGSVDYVGRGFGVLKFRPADAPDGSPSVDIAWPRTEKAGGSGSRQDFTVQSDPYLPMMDDLARRDFTINAMAWDFDRRDLIDPFAGMKDLDLGLVRAVRDPEERFREDYSRMMRAVRFACQLGFKIEQDTWGAIISNAGGVIKECELPNGKKERVVPYETVAKEFLKALDADAVRAIQLFEESGMLFMVVPEFRRMSETRQTPEWHSEGNVWIHSKLALKSVCSPDFKNYFPGKEPTVETKLTVLMHDIGKPEAMDETDGKKTFYGHDVVGSKIVRSVIDRLRLSSVAGITVRPNRVVWLIKNHLFPIFVELDSVRKTTLHRYFLEDEEAGSQLLQVSFADLSASVPEDRPADPSRLKQIMVVLDELRDEMKKTEKTSSELSGSEVMQATGLSQGPEIGKLLDELREAQLNGAVSSHEEAVALLRKIADRA